MKNINKILGGVVTLVISIALLPIISDSIEPLLAVGGAFEDTATGSLLELLPMILVVVFVSMAVVMIPKRD